MLDAKPQTRVIVKQAPAPPLPPDRPGSEDELHAIAAKRGELQQQLESLTERREEIADQLHGAEQAARPGIVARLQIIDDRIASLEQQILQADDAITAGLASGIALPPIDQTGTVVEDRPGFGGFGDDSIRIMGLEALAFVLLGIVLYRLGWHRAKRQFAGATPNDSGRMDQLQNAVDAIAVEIERISEGQRYVTKRLNEGSAGAEPISVGQEEAIPVRRKAT